MPNICPPIVVDGEGNVVTARQVSSPNQDDRPPGTKITLLVLHGISLPPGMFGGDEIEALFCNVLDPQKNPYFPQLLGSCVSAHFLIRRDGAPIQFVACGRRAWHAGESAWKGHDHCNDYSIGIELEGTDHVPYERAQYLTLAGLVCGLKKRYPIQDIVGHSDISPGRKTDPGPSFDWSAFRSLLRL